MEIARVPAGRGVDWLRQGWELFRASPGLWAAMAAVYIILYLVLSAIPGIGDLALSLIAPALGGGMIFGAAELRHGRPLDVSQLFQAFLDRSRTGPMLLLGVFNLAVVAAMTAIGAATALGVMHGGLAPGAAPQMPTLAPGMIIGILLMLTLAVLVAMALWFAVPLVMLGYATPKEAIRLSFAASSHNIWPLTVYGLCLAVLGLIALIPLGLGLLVFIPLGATSVYASVEEIFARERPTSGNHEPA
ncbi:MAG: BPSS1780 family membrane protein [Gammaproteobacteria bacterium]